jgi:hypothetical protein
MKNKIISSILLVWIGLTGCTRTEIIERKVPPAVDTKTLILYGNIGQQYFKANVEAAGKAIASGTLGEGYRVLVCDEILGEGNAISKNVIYELVADESSKKGFTRDTLIVHQGADVRQTLDPADMRFLLGEMRALTPESVSFGLALGTHGRGWLPKNYDDRTMIKMRSGKSAAGPFAVLWEHSEEPKTRYLGHTISGHDYRIDTYDFAAAMGDLHWDFILMDVCLMGNIESLYDMREIADYFIVSPAEVLIEGFPYQRIVSTLFADGADWDDPALFETVAHEYIEYYDESSLPCATVSVIDASQLEGLAEAVRDVRLGGFNPIDDELLGTIQSFEGMSVHVFYDFDEYMSLWAQDPASYDRFKEQLAQTVIYKESTDFFYSDLGSKGKYPIDHYSGMTAFVDAPDTDYFTYFYKQTAWYKAVWRD